jgi:hypothetical protein
LPWCHHHHVCSKNAKFQSFAAIRAFELQLFNVWSIGKQKYTLLLIIIKRWIIPFNGEHLDRGLLVAGWQQQYLIPVFREA